jgi:hypothetical protein
MKNDGKADKEYEAWKQSVIDFYLIGKNFKEQKIAFDKRREKFYAQADEYFVDKSETKEIFATDDFSSPAICTVNKVQHTVVNFDADKLEDKLGKEYCQEFINKSYEVQDMAGLIEYLKSCGVSPKKFKSFLKVTKTVDTKKIDQLFLTAKLSEKDVEGCYTAEKKSRYYTVKVEKKK